MSKEENYVWEFTNKRKLTKSEFIDYLERKIFRTIRKFSMLPEDKIITLKKSSDLNTAVLRSVLEKKFEVNWSNTPNFSNINLSKASEITFENITKGEFSGPIPESTPKMPLYYLSDKEIELYSSLKGIKGRKRKINEHVQKLFHKFIKKNQDLEVNIVKALSQVMSLTSGQASLNH